MTESIKALTKIETDRHRLLDVCKRWIRCLDRLKESSGHKELYKSVSTTIVMRDMREAVREAEKQ